MHIAGLHLPKSDYGRVLKTALRVRLQADDDAYPIAQASRSLATPSELRP
jgi:hypothetical protein